MILAAALAVALAAGAYLAGALAFAVMLWTLFQVLMFVFGGA